MNLDDLRSELDARAGAAAGMPAAQRLAGIRDRRRQRRVRTAGTLVAAGLAVVLGAVWLPGPWREVAVAPAVRHPVQPPVWQVGFAHDLAGDPLVASGHSRGGAFDLRFTPVDTNLALVAYCLGATGEAVVTVNDQEIASYACSRDAKPSIPLSRGEDEAVDANNREGWGDLGIFPETESVIRVRLGSGTRANELGVAFYERSGPRVTPDGVTLRQRIVEDDGSYRLDGYCTQRITDDTTPLEFNLPAGAEGQGLIMAGLADGPGRDVPTKVVVDGETQLDGGTTGLMRLPWKVRPEHIRVSVTGAATGTLAIAYYVKEPVP